MLRLIAFIIAVCCLEVCIGQDRYNNILDNAVRRENFNGVVLVATHGKIDFLSAKGLANRTYDIPIDSKTRFKIASVTKTFTAVLVLQLVEKGQLALDATVSKYLPEYQGQGRDKVTIHHLLTYSSGIPNCEGKTGLLVYQQSQDVDSFIARYCSGNLEYEPGTQFNYNNGDYILLGRIIEKITGKSFIENLTERILKPLQMSNTGLLHSKDIVQQLADTYNLDDRGQIFYKDDPMYIENYYAAGAMYSTAEDLLKFDSALFKYVLLSKKYVDLMLTPYPELYGVAYGFWVTDNKYGNQSFKSANRQGSIWGANANWLHLIENGKTFIVLSNTNATDLSKLTELLVLVATGQSMLDSDSKD